MKPTIGRIVHFVLGDGTVRPAIITQVWSDTCINARVFLDGSNDMGSRLIERVDGSEYTNPVCSPDGWASSVCYDEGVEEMVGGEAVAPVASMTYKPRTWHWPVRE